MREAVIVFGGGDEAAATGGCAGLLVVVGGNAVGGGLGDELAFLFVVSGGKAGALVGGNVEAGVFHAERGEDVVAVEVGQRLAGELFDDVALDVHGHAVGPSVAGLIEERDLRQLVNHLLQVLDVACAWLKFAVHAVDGRVGVAIGEAGGVGHELAHGGRVVGLGEKHFAGGVEAVEDLEVRELGDELRDGVGGEPLALFVEDHHGDAGDGLGHGVVAEDGVFGHGGGGGQVAHAVGAVVDDFAVAGEDGDGSGELLVVDLVLNGGVETLKALGRRSRRTRAGRGSCRWTGADCWAWRREGQA